MARLFQRLLALVFLVAWLSLGAQVDELIGSRGLLPIAPLLERMGEPGWRALWNFPTVFWLVGASDWALRAGVAFGVALSAAALAGFRPRLCFGLATLLYLSFVTAGRTFFSFQWDNLLLECGFLAVFLPADRPAPWIHFLFRLLLFKLYWESGVAKWQSGLHDWHDGSAMRFYYETAPLPAWPAWYAHALPAWWHHLESWATLFLELVVPLAFFAGRRLRLAACTLLTVFQVANLATANYGFFVYLSLCLHVFLLGDQDVVRARERLAAWLPARPRWHASPPTAPADPPRWLPLRRAGAAMLVVLFAGVSMADGLLSFGGPGAWRRTIEPLRAVYQPLRLVNTYHLFAHITRQRIEPEFQALIDGRWTPLWLRYKPGDPLLAPGFVAPHQPRVDFQLWFHGLGYRRGTPEYVATLVRRLCSEPEAVAGLFPDPPTASPAAVRIAYWDYRFTTAAEQRESGAWWRRRLIETAPPLHCTTPPPG